MMPKGLLLITGGSGHIGFRTIIQALTAGYSVRAAVRSQAKADLISAAPSIKRLNPGNNLSFAIVRDIVAPNAYDEAVSGVSGIIHIASPMFAGLTQDEWEYQIVNPAVAATINVLNAATKESSTKRVVITSSFFATIPWNEFSTPSSEIWSTTPAPLPTARPFQIELEAYAASKVYALHATNDWMAENRHHFDVVNMLPAIVFGRNELVTSTKAFMAGTNPIVMSMPLGIDNPLPITGTTVHLDDVAWAHVRAIDQDIPAGTYPLNSNWESGIDFSDTAAIVAQEFPGAVEKGILKNNGKLTTLPLKFDASETERIFGLKFKGYEEQVKSIVGHWLELYEAEQNEG